MHCTFVLLYEGEEVKADRMIEKVSGVLGECGTPLPFESISLLRSLLALASAKLSEGSSK